MSCCRPSAGSSSTVGCVGCPSWTCWRRRSSSVIQVQMAVFSAGVLSRERAQMSCRRLRVPPESRFRSKSSAITVFHLPFAPGSCPGAPGTPQFRVITRFLVGPRLLGWGDIRWASIGAPRGFSVGANRGGRAGAGCLPLPAVPHVPSGSWGSVVVPGNCAGRRSLAPQP